MTRLIFAALFTLACTSGVVHQQLTDTAAIAKKQASDSSFRVPDPCDRYIRENDSLNRIVLTLERRYDSIKIRQFDALYKISRVQYYLNIANKRPSQVKFLRSWITRAIQ
jgi:hypothetical protein